MSIEHFFATIVGIFSVLGIFYGMLRNFKIDILEAIDKVDKKVDKLEETVKDIDRRLCRLEGAFSSRDFCGLRNHDSSKHAE